MFTPVTRRGGGCGKKETSKAPNFLAAPGRERPARSCEQLEREGQGESAAAEEVGTARTSPASAQGSEEKALRFGRRRQLPRTRRGRGQSPSPEPAGPQSQRRPRSPQLRGRQVPPAAAGGSGGWAGSPHPLPGAWLREQTVALTWLVRRGRDGHGSGARGGTSSPGKDRLFRRGAGESGRQAVRSPVSEAAPWTPTRSFSVAAGPPSHYPPPSSVAAASTSSSAETPRPLHTLSHHAAGEPLPPVRHFRPQVVRSRLGAGGAWGTGGGHSKGISVTVSLPRAGVVVQSAGRHFG